MPSSNILLFDANKANMMADEQYSTNTQRLNGVQSGIASSQLQNKTLYQVSLVAYAIAQIMNQNGLDANDTAAVSAFVANLSGTMLQKVADLASTQEAQAGVATGKWMSPALVKAAMDTYTSGKFLPLSGGTMTGNLILNADPTTNLGAATKQYVDEYVDKSSFKKVYNGNLTDGQTISAVTKYRVMVGFVTITHDISDGRYPYVSIDGLYLGECRGKEESYTDYCNFILFNFANKSGTFYWSYSGSSRFTQTQNKALTGKITFDEVNSANLSLYAIS